MFPHVADDVVGYDGFPRPWANFCWAPGDIACEQRAVNGHGQLFARHDSLDAPQTVLPARRQSRGIERRDIKPNTRRTKINLYPVEQPALCLLARFPGAQNLR